jgi:DNA-binding winged helix-turn-helix (wHTH) protein
MITYIVGPLVLDPQLLIVRRGNVPLPLGPKVVTTLLALVENRGDVVSSGVLERRIWPEGFVSHANLSQNIYILRKAFCEHGVERAIEHVRCRGYRLLVAVTVVKAPTVATRQAHPWLSIAAAALALIIGGSAVPLPPATGPIARDGLSPSGARAYLMGRYYLDQRTQAGVRRSIDFFTRTIDSDPTDARGYAGMADANVIIGDYCYGTHRPAVYFARARQYAQTALRLQPNSAEALAADAFMKLHERRTSNAAAELDRAIARAPDYADAHEWRGIAYSLEGNQNAALRELRTALRLDPLSVSTVEWVARLATRQLSRTHVPANHQVWAAVEQLL